MMALDGDDNLADSMFREPEGYREAERSPTFTEYHMRSGEVLSLRLVGHNPLWVSQLPSYTCFSSSYSSFRVIISGMAVK